MSSYGNHVWTPEYQHLAELLVHQAMDCNDDGFAETLNGIGCEGCLRAITALLAEALSGALLTAEEAGLPMHGVLGCTDPRGDESASMEQMIAFHADQQRQLGDQLGYGEDASIGHLIEFHAARQRELAARLNELTAYGDTPTV